MDEDKLKHFEEMLIAEKKKLKEELSSFTTQNPNDPDDYKANFSQLGEKEDENAAEVAEYSKNLTLERELERSLKDVRKALIQIKEGTYGICKYCQKEVGEKRLEARPTSNSCIDCKKLLTE